MITKYSIYRPGRSEPEDHEIEWPADPGHERIKHLIGPILGNDEPPARVTVRHNGEPKDMYVSELGHVQLMWRGPLPINHAATQIYRNAWLTAHPETSPDQLPEIAGVAVLFHRRVWF